MEFVEIPNIPNKKVSKVIIDYRISEESEKTLNNNGITCIKTKKCNSVYDEISGHPDIQLIHLGENELIVEKSMYNEYSEIFKNIDVNNRNKILELSLNEDVFCYDFEFMDTIISLLPKLNLGIDKKKNNK